MEEHSPLNQLSRAHMGSQRLKWQAWGLQGSIPGPLHICYAAWCFVGLCLWLSYLLLGLFPSYWIALSSLDMRDFALYYWVVSSMFINEDQYLGYWYILACQLSCLINSFLSNNSYEWFEMICVVKWKFRFNFFWGQWSVVYIVRDRWEVCPSQ